jgi:heterodisulfide reductase subunit A
MARTARLEQVEDQRLEMVKSGLVIGGGVAGMTAALNLAEQGFPVHLLEKPTRSAVTPSSLQHTIKGEDTAPHFLDRVGR